MQLDIGAMCRLCTRLRTEERETFRDGTTEMRAVCAAFPDGIPAALLEDRADHRKPVPNDNGLRYRPVDDDAALTVERMFARR